GTGDSVLGITRTLNGDAKLTGRKGAIVGFDVAELLRRLERRPLSAGSGFRTGRTLYDKIAVALKIAQGKVSVGRLKIVGPNVDLAMAGSASIPSRDLDLAGTAALVEAPRPSVAAFSLPFIVQGSWDDPIMLPDAEALIRRSGAAAPLLNAVRDRRARGAARRVIDQLTGGASADATPAAEKATASPSKP
ncbi:MAG: AsmA-like C-terminal region-containing protein, partial [Pseudolabrys sp.]